MASSDRKLTTILHNGQPVVKLTGERRQTKGLRYCSVEAHANIRETSTDLWGERIVHEK
ncbi:hypothetical protein LGN22_16930 [Burkholderia cenocepacia]|uniref:Uncharacterized protein n=1 Tax=Burkholderia cenocepacia TaxID=95486 RepID=A0AAW4TI45_9BURK|nr:hypothetical protein [Burkholderia cenocepacia]MCA8380559.1 hypothetical protein [Burkholderia cenocepacia]